MQLQNPFRYGREVDDLVDREAEVAAVVAVARSAGTMFLLGPRRFGKTSILKAASTEAGRLGTVVLRYDAEAFETVDLLATTMAAGAARAFASTVDRAGEVLRRFFGALKPRASFDLTHQTLSVEFGLSRDKRRESTPVLTEVFNGIERLAAEHRRPTAVILDEFQEVIAEGGERAEKQIRAAVQTHRHVAYIFAGSKTRLLADMTGHASRPFWKMGDRRILGPIPRADFRPFVRDGLAASGAIPDDAAVEHILDLAEDVPYNVQWLSSKCWDAARLQGLAVIDVARVDAVLERLLDEDHAVYMQLWANLTVPQRRTLKAVAGEAGVDFNLAAVARAARIPPSTMQRTLEALEDRSIIRRDATETGASWRLDDPFFSHWLNRVQAVGSGAEG